ncbi:MAG: SDR family oxidoreductase [Alphaproteobacteria bacterium]|nr:SDR family oxidoreductase [Alphaproteobacteria bacterium]
MASVLITGANRGLGLELARQYADDGWRVFAATRDPDAAHDLRAAVAAANGRASLHRLDVGDRRQIQALAQELDREPVDVLINNAGVMESWDYTFGKIDYALWKKILHTNVLAPVNVTRAFIPHLTRGGRKLVVTFSSGLGSMADNTEGRRLLPGKLYMYRTAKAAMNMAAHNMAIDLRPRGIAVIALSPGHVRTAMGGPNAALGIEESITAVRKTLARLAISDSGKFFFYDGTEYPW